MNISPTLLRWLGFLLGLSAALAAAAGAQTLGPDRVTFFTEPNYRGEALTVEAGASIENLAQMARADRVPWLGAISSVRVEGAAHATVFSEPGFRGDRLEIAASVSDLYGETRGRSAGGTWDRVAASIVVARTRPSTVVIQPHREPPPTTVYVVPAPPPPPPPVVVEPRPRYDVRAADEVIFHAYREVLGRGADPTGVEHYREKLLREGWTEQQVIQDLQRSREARSINPDAAIAQAYREVLGRDPDPAGLNHYRKLWRDGWTQGQMREDLRRSVEGQAAAYRTVIARVYHEVLGHPPDAASYAVYEKLMREKGWTEREIRATLLQSDEYRQSHRGR